MRRGRIIPNRNVFSCRLMALR